MLRSTIRSKEKKQQLSNLRKPENTIYSLKFQTVHSIMVVNDIQWVHSRFINSAQKNG